MTFLARGSIKNMNVLNFWGKQCGASLTCFKENMLMQETAKKGLFGGKCHSFWQKVKIKEFSFIAFFCDDICIRGRIRLCS